VDTLLSNFAHRFELGRQRRRSTPVGAKAASAAEKSATGRILERQADRAERIAANNPRAAKQEAAAAARGAQRDHVNGAAAAAGVSASNAASSAFNIACTATNGDC
jgi:hypothetical protein